MIIVVGGIKGGSGKTTLATNLAVIRSADGKKVLLTDADEQKSSSDWAQQREESVVKTSFTTVELSGKAVNAQIQKMAKDYDDIIIDVGGRDTTSQRSALTIADIFLIPFKPRSLDIWTLGALKNMISEIKSVNPILRCIAVINQADPRGEDNLSAMQFLSECGTIECCPHSIGCRKAFGNAASEGLAVTELKNKDLKSNLEMFDVYGYVFSTYKTNI